MDIFKRNYSHLLLIIFILLYCLRSSAQNLLLNPSFEECTRCPDNDSVYYDIVKNWMHATYAIPDYYNACGEKGNKVPYNYEGFLNAKHGQAYIGIILHAKGKNYREYIQGELREPLISGKKYLVTFYVAPTYRSRRVIDAIGLHLSEKRVRNYYGVRLNVKPQISNPKGTIISDSTKWTKITGVYTAQGGEKYITIGNFVINKKLSYIEHDNKPRFLNNRAYYYIDDVNIILIED